MKFYTRYNPPEGSTLDQSGQTSRTVTSEADSCDINKIMERFNRTGQLPKMQHLPPNYGDARVVDYQTALEIVSEAKSRFNELSAEARKYFNHDPQMFLNAISDASEANVSKLLELGIITQRDSTEKELLTEIVKNTKVTEKVTQKKD